MIELRVVSFNIRNGRAIDGRQSWPFRRRSTAMAIARLDADAIGLQEVLGFQLQWLRSQLPAYEAVGAGRSRGQRGERCPVLTHRAGVRLLDSCTRWYGDQPDRPGSRLAGAPFPRVATMCRLELEAGAVIQLTNTHLDARSSDHRQQSAEQLRSWLDPELPQIVVGDLNAKPDDPVLRTLAEAGLIQALPAHAGGTAHSFTGRADGRRVDHILASRHFEVTAAGVADHWGGGPLPSDHWPVVATLRLTAPSPTRAQGDGGSVPPSGRAGAPS